MADNRQTPTSSAPPILLAAAIAVLLGAQHLMIAGTEDDWTPVEAKPESWRFVDVDGDCQRTSKNGKILIETPGTIHDLVGDGQRNAPRLLVNRDGDFALSVRVGGRLAPQRTESDRFAPYQGAGILVWAGEASYIRLERAQIRQPDSGALTYVNFEEHGPTGGRPIKPVQLPDDGPLFLRVERRGSRVTGYMSRDGSTWDELGDTTLKKTKVTSVGLLAVNNTDAPFTPEFSDIKLFATKSR